MSEPKTTRIVLADDHEKIRELMLEFLSMEPGFDVVASVTNGTDALHETATRQPDVVVLDMSMPGGLSGLEVCRRLREDHPAIEVVMISSYDHSDYVHEVMLAGGRGYVVKPRLTQDLIPAVQAAREGRTFVSEGLLTD